MEVPASQLLLHLSVRRCAQALPPHNLDTRHLLPVARIGDELDNLQHLRKCISASRRQDCGEVLGLPRCPPGELAAGGARSEAYLRQVAKGSRGKDSDSDRDGDDSDSDDGYSDDPDAEARNTSTSQHVA